MNFLNKITTYALVTAAGLSVGLSAAPHQASAINLVGQNLTTNTNLGRFKGQTVDFTIGGAFGGTNRPGVIVNSIKFALNTNAAGLTAKPFTVSIFDVTSGNPTFADTVSGAGAILGTTSAAAVYVTPDGSFTNNVSYLLFTFTGGTPELATNRQYGFFLNAPSNNTFFTTTGSASVRGDSVNSYSGGQGFQEGTTGPNGNGTFVLAGGQGDSAFIVDATPVPFEFEASGGVAILGGLFLAKKLKNRKQDEKVNEQA
ncbi:MAG: hypothetical protein DCE90_03200 [Pseudanabaena sp.]|nr:MAG: hypothetical protein DCE90_03200 [Pseudanabaena sp.]